MSASPEDVIAGVYVGGGPLGDRASAILAALRAAGYAVVPVEASDEMCIAATARNDRGEDRDRDAYGLYRTIYRAMIAAAGEPT